MVSKGCIAAYDAECIAPALSLAIPYDLRLVFVNADLTLFTATANLSIVCLNLSLMLNPVSLYQVRVCVQIDSPRFFQHTSSLCNMQIAKLLIIPFVCLVEKFWLGKEFTRGVITSVLVVVSGVAIV